MRYARRALSCLALGACCFALASCSGLPFGLGSSGSSAPTAPPKLVSKAATGSVAATATKSAATSATSAPAAPKPKPPVAYFASEPKPKPSDPLLAPGPWHYHSLTKYEVELPEGNLGPIPDAQANFSNGTVDLVEDAALSIEQGILLRRLMRKSTRVHSIINHNDGESEDASYTVLAVDATAEMGPSTPWVTATLRATFGTPDGVKALDLYVYRMHTRKGLDNRPYVGGAQIGFLDNLRNMVNPKPVKF